MLITVMKYILFDQLSVGDWDGATWRALNFGDVPISRLRLFSSGLHKMDLVDNDKIMYCTTFGPYL